MTLLKKLVCKSVKEDQFYCNGEYDRKLDAACVRFDSPEPRKKSRQKPLNSSPSSSKPQTNGASKSRRNPHHNKQARQMKIPHPIPEQTGIQHKHPEFEDLSENDFVVNAVRKTLNNRKPKRRLFSKASDADSVSTVSALTLDMHGTKNPRYYYGKRAHESDMISEEGAQAFHLASTTLNLVQQQQTPHYQSERAEEDEADGYLDQCMGMLADLLVGEAAVPKDEVKRKQIAQEHQEDEKPNYDLQSQNEGEYGDSESGLITDGGSEMFKMGSSQNTYTDESSRDSCSSYDGEESGSEFTGNHLFCSP